MHVLASCTIFIVANDTNAITQIVQADQTEIKGIHFETIAGWYTASGEILSNATLLIVICIQSVWLKAKQIVNIDGRMAAIVPSWRHKDQRMVCR